MKISIICATIDSAEVINAFVLDLERKLSISTCNIEAELIIVNQSDNFKEESLIQVAAIDIKYLFSSKRGLSFSRNLGISVAQGDWLMFLDSDCSLCENFVPRFISLSRLHQDVAVFFGKILSVEKALPIFRPWPFQKFVMSDLAVWRYATSVNCIYKRDSITFFDEKLGIGADFGSCEDVDFGLDAQGLKMYCPELVVFHPDQLFASQPISKIYNYSRGFGALCRKRLWPWGLPLLLISVFKKAIHALLGRVSLSLVSASIKGRVSGFFLRRLV
jgi:glycosyltransferase involved in cell wall biosynthesis